MVWAPKSDEEYASMSGWRRGLETCLPQRGGRPWLYYLIEMWWLRMFFPRRARYMPSRRRVFPCSTVRSHPGGGRGPGSAASIWTGGRPLVQSLAWLLFCGLRGNRFIFLERDDRVFVVYVHHTHTRDQPGYSDKARLELRRTRRSARRCTLTFSARIREC